MSEWIAEFVGGPYDGERRKLAGPKVNYPRPPERYRGYAAGEDLPTTVIFHVGYYELQRGDDGQFLYIHVEHA